MRRKYLLFVLVGLATVAMSCLPASAQVNEGNLVGVIADNTGAVIPGASIQLTNVGTGAIRTQKSDSTGLYRFAVLNYGTYSLQIKSPGFKTEVRQPIQISTGETTTVNIALAVGQEQQTVVVTSESPLLRTETGSLGTTLSGEMVEALPQVGRNPYALIQLSPGVQYTTDTEDIHVYDNHATTKFNSSGSSSSAEFLLDGIPNMAGNYPGFIPSPDTVQEMRVQTNAYDAEFGQTGAASVNVSTRSGTNQVHGTAYWYFRNAALDANDYFNNLNGDPKGPLNRNIYGGSISGPVVIPKIYNGHKRMFYFFNFEQWRLNENTVGQYLVPTQLERTGDFSQTTDSDGNPYTIYDPATTRPDGNGGYIRDPFPGNIIPADRLDPVAVQAMKYYPLPNMTPTSSNWENFQLPQVSGTNWSSLVARVDYNVTDSQKLYVRFGWNRRFDPSTPAYGATCCAAAGNPNGTDEFRRGNKTAAVGYTWIVSPRMVVDFRAGLTQYYDADVLFSDGFDIASLGFASSFTGSVNHGAFPRFVMDDDVDSLGPNANVDGSHLMQYNPSVTVHNDLGRHALKYGLSYQIAQDNETNYGRPTGKFEFDHTFTQGPDPTQSANDDGNDIASFLLGDVTTGSVTLNAQPALENKYYAGFIQDNWKALKRLTLNLGFRVAHETPVTDRHNRLNAGFDPSAASPVAAQAEANYLANPIPGLPTLNVHGGLQFVGVNGAPRSAFNTHTVYAPRFGYALQLTNFMVWRGGFGLYYVPNYISNYEMDGFSTQTDMVSTLDGGLTPFNKLSNPFPAGQVKPLGPAGGLMTDIGHSMTQNFIPNGAKLPDFKNGMSEQFSTSFQFVLPSRVSVEASYVGNVSQRLTISRNVNDYPNQYLALKTGLDEQVPNPFYGVITDPTSSLSESTVAVSQLLKPFPQYTGITETLLPAGRSNYNSLQVDVQKRETKGLTLGAAYTFSKFMEAVSYLNPNDARPFHVVSANNHPHHISLYGTYELPFGTNKRFLSTANPALRQVVGGWQATWSGNIQSGSPLSFPGAVRTSISTHNPHTRQEWFDVNQFAIQQPFTLATLAPQVSDLLSPGVVNFDLAAGKVFSISERYKLEFKSEFYNAFNHEQFSAPKTDVTSSRFGRITSSASIPRQVQLNLRLTF